MELTSRSALRTIHDGNKPLNLQPQKASIRTSLFKTSGVENERRELSSKDYFKPGLEVHTDPVRCKTKTEVKEPVVVKSPVELCDIERMHICDPEEGLRPRIEGKSESVMRRIRNWGLTCLYPTHDVCDSGSESEDEFVLPNMDTRKSIDEFDSFLLRDLSDIEVPDFDLDVPLPAIENIPSIDEIPIPFLDDSLDIEPNMGTLEVWDTSTPLTMSPCTKQMSDCTREDQSSNIDHNTSL